MLTLSHTTSLPDVKGGFDLMAADLKGMRLFVAAQDNDTVEIIDLKAGKWLGRLSELNDPKWIVYLAERQRIYVANGGTGACSIFDAKTLRPIKQLQFKEKANNLRYDPESKLLYVGVGNTFGSLGIIDTVKESIVGEILLANFPKQFELERNGQRIFVNVPSANHVAVVDRQTRKVIATWPIKEAKENVPMGQDAGSRRLFIGCDPGTLVVLDVASGKSVASVPIHTGCDGVYYDSQRKRIYISCGEGFIDVIKQIDADHYERTESIPTAAGAGTSLLLPTLNKLILAVPERKDGKAEIRGYQVQ
ncbi:MAG: hypothetical protein M1457_07855 [bacterium]|nr:hypothetical protein [bacterium]